MEEIQPSQLWKQMSEARRLEAARAFWEETDGLEQQVEAMALLAQKMKARPKFVQGMPADRKAKVLANYPGMPDILAARLLVSYHLARQRPMMASFLDALGVAHDNGLITEDPSGPIPADRLHQAAASLAAAYPADDVSLYFGTLVAQDPDTWGGLAGWPGAPGR